MPSIEDILLLRAQQEAAERPSMGQAALAGAALGGTAGVLAGNVPHQMGRLLNRATGRTPNRLKMGGRAAGGLALAIAGGALGAGMQQAAVDTSPAAALLAKAQVQGDLSAYDQDLLQQILTEEYSKMGLI